MNVPLRILAERLSDRRFLEGFFYEELQNQSIRVDDCFFASAALANAKRSLLEEPDQIVALVGNANSTDPIAIDERRGSIHRILGQVAADGWHASFAVPRLDAWAVADTRIRAALDREPERLGPDHYVDRAVEFARLVQEAPFDRNAARSQFDEFRALDDFVQRHVAVAETT